MYNSHITSSCGRRKRYAAGHWREIHMKTMKKLWLMVAALSVTTLLCVISASACTMVYVGSDYTADGSTFMARSEDYSNSYNKIAYVSQHGKHAAGSIYEGCYGFTHTFTHDSYRRLRRQHLRRLPRLRRYPRPHPHGGVRHE